MIIIREHINNHTSPLSNANYSLLPLSSFASINHHFPDLESQSFHVNQPDKHCTLIYDLLSAACSKKSENRSASQIRKIQSIDSASPCMGMGRSTHTLTPP
eukprot:COSAG01_NODE_170_length_23136_cov_24.853931_19_plen_101_part_00